MLDLFGLIRDGVCGGGEQLLNWAQRDVGCHRALQILPLGVEEDEKY